jgi:hypothetical protein
MNYAAFALIEKVAQEIGDLRQSVKIENATTGKAQSFYS